MDIENQPRQPHRPAPIHPHLTEQLVNDQKQKIIIHLLQIPSNALSRQPPYRANLDMLFHMYAIIGSLRILRDSISHQQPLVRKLVFLFYRVFIFMYSHISNLHNEGQIPQ